MVRHQNLLVIVAILFLAAIILAAKMQRRLNVTVQHYSLAPLGTCITVAYGPHVNEGANLLDLYLPENSTAAQINNNKTTPLIVFIHGGAWQTGDKSMVPSPKEFTDRGYALASINYRLTGDTPHPAQIEDCKTAINWLHDHAKIFKINPDRIGVWGMSAGGHLVALLGTTCDINSPTWASPHGVPCHVEAVCDWCGPTDLTTMAGQAGSHYVLAQAVTLFLQGTPAGKLSLAREASPMTYVHKGLPPFLIMHGDRDTIVPVEQSKEFAKALKAAHVNVTLQIVPGANHNFANTKTINTVFHFFDSILKKGN